MPVHAHVQLVFIPDAALKPKVFKWTSPEKPDWVLDGALRRRFHSLVPLCSKSLLDKRMSILSNYDDSFCSKPCKEVVEPVEPRFRASTLYFYSICQNVSPPGCWQLIEATNVTSEPFFGLLSLNTFTSMLHGLPSHRGHLKNAPKARVRAPPLVDLCNRYYLKVNRIDVEWRKFVDGFFTSSSTTTRIN